MGVSPMKNPHGRFLWFIHPHDRYSMIFPWYCSIKPQWISMIFPWSSRYITKGSLLAGYLEFYFAKQRGGLDPLSLNDQEKGTPPPPPPSKGTLAICLVSLFTQQPLRSVSSSSPSSSSTSSSPSSSSSSPSSFDLTFGFFDIHFPSTQRCDESDRFEHP